MKFKLRGWPQGMMGISMRMRTQLVVVGHLQVKMSRYSVPERIALVKAYYASNNSPIAAQRKFATEYKLTAR
jgi:hypothetical protein